MPQWYPGHMAKTKRLIKEVLPLADAVIELLDARAPKSSRNADIPAIIGGKRHIIVFNKYDLADEAQSARWKRFYEKGGAFVVFANCLTGDGVNEIEKAVRNAVADKVAAQKARGRLTVTIRAMVLGVPNVGKSSLINRYAKKARAKTEDRPGVTRSLQWIKVKNDFEILDTPGILPPKFATEREGLTVAFTGGVKDSVTDTFSIANELVKFLAENYPANISSRYNVSAEALSEDGLEKIALSRGYLLSGGKPDVTRCAVMVLDEFRAGKIGRVTLDLLDNND
ncbi:ribosome biogenesis GTPase A [Clostridia bacterium]|nr:ribosome biogenesis GTPase A [Clostridia bacterium]